MLKVLRVSFPDAYIAMLLRRYTGTIMEGNPYVDELIWYDDGAERVPLSEMKATLSRKQFDAAIVVYPTLRLAWLMFRSRIPIRVGTGYRYYSMLFNRRVYEHRKDAKRHELEYNVNLLRELGCDSHGAPEFFIHIPSDAEHAVAQIMVAHHITRPFAVLHPGTGGSAREWPLLHFCDLASRLVGRPMTVVVTGSKAEQEKVSSIVRSTGGRAIPLAGALNLKELAALLRQAAVFVSNSTGPLHLAAAMGTPVVGLYPQIPAMSPKRWGPYAVKRRVFVPDKPRNCTECTGARGEHCACMASITVDKVYQGVQELLADASYVEEVDVHE